MKAGFPLTVMTRDGANFDPRSNVWVIRDGAVSARLDFHKITEIVDDKFLVELKLVLIWFAENKSLSHLANIFKRAASLVSYIGQKWGTAVTVITGTHLLHYYSSLPQQNRWYLGTLSTFLKRWHLQGYAAIARDAVGVLNDLVIPGNVKGVAVLTMDPRRGPFTDLETESLQSKLNDEFARGNIDKSDFLLTWLFMLLGKRPKQYALLKVSDLIVKPEVDQTCSYALRVPRGKTRGVAREEFKVRPITWQVGRVLHKYAIAVEENFVGRLDDTREAPLFPQAEAGDQPPGMYYHSTNTSIGRRLTSTLSRLMVTSERTGEPLHINPRRFRSSLGTRAAREGHGELVIAELLDHTDVQYVGVYVQALPEIVERIDRALAMKLAPLAQAFSGKVVTNSNVAKTEKVQPLYDPRITSDCKTLGGCGSHSYCSFAAPIACYTCVSFEAWSDGPHEKVLKFLLDERDRKRINTDARIASVNDRTIYAVAEVVQLCAAYNADADESSL